MNFEVSNVFGHYEGYVDRDTHKVRAIQPSTGKSVTLNFDDFRETNPAPELAAKFGGGCRGIHIKVRELIKKIDESEEASEQQPPNIIKRLNGFCSRHYILITITLSVLSVLIAFVALL